MNKGFWSDYASNVYDVAFRGDDNLGWIQTHEMSFSKMSNIRMDRCKTLECHNNAGQVFHGRDSGS